MAVVINPNNEDIHELSAEEAKAFFEAAVQEQLGVSSEEFLRRRDDFRNDPHFDAVMFLLPLVENVQDWGSGASRVSAPNRTYSKLHSQYLGLLGSDRFR
jgi:hypothetical protein